MWEAGNVLPFFFPISPVIPDSFPNKLHYYFSKKERESVKEEGRKEGKNRERRALGRSTFSHN
jgi:hypothetical protein